LAFLSAQTLPFWRVSLGKLPSTSGCGSNPTPKAGRGAGGLAERWPRRADGLHGALATFRSAGACSTGGFHRHDAAGGFFWAGIFKVERQQEVFEMMEIGMKPKSNHYDLICQKVCQEKRCCLQDGIMG